MAANVSPIFVKNITAKGQTWTNSDAASTKKVITPTVGAEGCRVQAIAVTSDDTSNRDFALYANDGTNDYLLGTVTIPLNAGSTAAVAAISFLSKVVNMPWISSDGSMLLPTGWSLKMMNLTQVTAAKTVTVVTTCGDY